MLFSNVINDFHNLATQVDMIPIYYIIRSGLWLQLEIKFWNHNQNAWTDFLFNIIPFIFHPFPGMCQNLALTGPFFLWWIGEIATQVPLLYQIHINLIVNVTLLSKLDIRGHRKVLVIIHFLGYSPNNARKWLATNTETSHVGWRFMVGTHYGLIYKVSRFVSTSKI